MWGLPLKIMTSVGRGGKYENLKKKDLWRSSIKTRQKGKKSQLIDILIFLEKIPDP